MAKRDCTQSTKGYSKLSPVKITNGIINTANSVSADLIVMGSHGRRGLGRLLLGSQTNNVLAHTAIPVLVTR